MWDADGEMDRCYEHIHGTESKHFTQAKYTSYDQG